MGNCHPQRQPRRRTDHHHHLFRRFGDFGCSLHYPPCAARSGSGRTQGLRPRNPVPAGPFVSSVSSASLFFFIPFWNKLSPKEQDEGRRIPADFVVASLKNDAADRHSRELADPEKAKERKCLRAQQASVIASICRAKADLHNQGTVVAQARMSVGTRCIDEIRTRLVALDSRQQLAGDLVASDRSCERRTTSLTSTFRT